MIFDHTPQGARPVLHRFLRPPRRAGGPPTRKARRQATSLAVLGLAVISWLLGAASSAGANVSQTDPSTSGDGKGEVTLRIFSAGGDGADVRIVADLAAVLNDIDQLRIVPIVGTGGRRNINDLLIEPALADVAIVQADALNAMKADPQSDVERKLRYIAKLFNEEVHVAARSDIEQLSGLGGKKVAVGVAGSGTNLTANAVFAALAIPIEALALDPATAMEKLKTGEIDAMVTVSGKPAGTVPALAEAAAPGGKLHLLSIPVNDALLVDYVPSTLSHDDDPELIAPGETIETISVPAVMVVATADPGSERGRAIATFVNALFTNFARFQSPPRHPKWREVNLAASVSGWRRLPVALSWVRVNMATAEEKKLHAAFADILRFLAKEGVRPGSKSLGEREREALFWQFVDWRAGQAAP